MNAFLGKSLKLRLQRTECCPASGGLNSKFHPFRLVSNSDKWSCILTSLLLYFGKSPNLNYFPKFLSMTLFAYFSLLQGLCNLFLYHIGNNINWYVSLKELAKFPRTRSFSKSIRIRIGLYRGMKTWATIKLFCLLTSLQILVLLHDVSIYTKLMLLIM